MIEDEKIIEIPYDELPERYIQLQSEFRHVLSQKAELTNELRRLKKNYEDMQDDLRKLLIRLSNEEIIG